ncbi:MAG: aminoacyl-tRNA hydrolase [Candidatus Omnitrophota bacterium]
MKLIVGLGNPGMAYKYSRHNVGFLIIDKIAKDWSIKIRTDTSIKSSLGKGAIEDGEVILAKPLCFMNRSGQPVKSILKKTGLNLKDMLLVFDDLDLEWGKIRVRPYGGSGGHKGVKSIIDALGGSDFSRLRFGIGRPGKKSEVVDYVLNRWSNKEKKELEEYLQRAAECCRTWVVSGISEAMNKFNQARECYE